MEIPADPEETRPERRLAEVTTIPAAGLLRLRTNLAGSPSSADAVGLAPDKRLDSPAAPERLLSAWPTPGAAERVEVGS